MLRRLYPLANFLERFLIWFGSLLKGTLKRNLMITQSRE